jgi:hypothetical protein
MGAHRGMAFGVLVSINLIGAAATLPAFLRQNN